MDNIELKIIDIDESLSKVLGAERYKFLVAKKADKLIILLKNNSICGNVAIYYNNVDMLEDRKIGLIGIIHTEDKECASGLLHEAIKFFESIGARKIIAPLDRDTWSEYRVKIKTSLEVPFYGEPNNPIWMPEVFSESEFEPRYRYISTSDGLVRKQEENVEGIYIREIDEIDLKHDLNLIYEISVKAFKNNLFYGDIDKNSFIKTYKYMYNKLKPEVVIAEYKGVSVGFLMGFDGGACEGNNKTFVFKTAAVLEKYRGLKIASKMITKMGNDAFDKGYRRIIGGLIYNKNVSYNLMKKYGGQVISEYALYEKNI